MSCDTRHRAIIANLLTLAGLTDTVDTDTVIRSGSGRRRQRDGLRGPESHLPPLHDEVRTAMGIIGHGADTLPAWVPALIALLVRECGRTNRRACLTLHLLTGGWDAVTSHLTDYDRAWLHTATAIGLAPPAAVTTRLIPLPAAAPIAWTLPDPMRRAVGLVTVLNALIEIDAIPPAAVQAVTSRQVLQVAVGGTVASRTDLQAVLRAVLEDTPAAQALRLVPNEIGTVLHLNPVPPSVSPRPAAWTEVGIARVLAHAAARIRAVRGPVLDPTALRDPSAEVIAAICSFLATQPGSVYDLAPVLAALMQLWRMAGREDTVTATIRHLETVLAQVPWLVIPLGASLLAAGMVAPPHGDVVFTQIGAEKYDHAIGNAWEGLAGAAVYAAACQQYGHRPTVDGLDDLVQNRWRTTTSTFSPSPIPLLAVGREHELLLPAIHAERDGARRATMLFDCVDAMAMLALVGGDTDGFRTVLLDAIPSACDPLDPIVVIRLAADRDGQAVLAHLPTVPTPPDWTIHAFPKRTGRYLLHLVSPAWETVPQPLRTWWETTLRHVAASSVAHLLDMTPPLYPTVAPQAAMAHPTITLAKRAVSHPSWATFPETERRECLTKALRHATMLPVFDIVARAATPAAMADIRATLPHAKQLHPDTVHALQALIDTDRRRL